MNIGGKINHCNFREIHKPLTVYLMKTISKHSPLDKYIKKGFLFSHKEFRGADFFKLFSLFAFPYIFSFFCFHLRRIEGIKCFKIVAGSGY